MYMKPHRINFQKTDVAICTDVKYGSHYGLQNCHLLKNSNHQYLIILFHLFEMILGCSVQGRIRLCVCSFVWL